MIAPASVFGAGFLFGLGLWLSGMADPAKVIGFLDLAGVWDPSLAFVMGGALAVTLAVFPLVLRRPSPLLARRFLVPPRMRADLPLFAGSVLFGLGWGTGGFCPGPALTALASLAPETLVFVIAMVAGGMLHRALFRTP